MVIIRTRPCGALRYNRARYLSPRYMSCTSNLFDTLSGNMSWITIVMQMAHSSAQLSNPMLIQLWLRHLSWPKCDWRTKVCGCICIYLIWTVITPKHNIQAFTSKHNARYTKDVTVNVGDRSIASAVNVRHIGVISDSFVNTEKHLQNMCGTGCAHLRDIGPIRH